MLVLLFLHLHYNWQQNRIGKIGDIFISVPILLIIPYEKNMHGNKNKDFLSIIHSSLTSIGLIKSSYADWNAGI